MMPMIRASQSITLVLIGSLVAAAAYQAHNITGSSTQPSTRSTYGHSGGSHFSFGNWFSGGGSGYSSSSSGSSSSGHSHISTSHGGFGSSAAGHSSGS